MKVSTEEIDAQEERAVRNGDVRLLGIAHLRRFVQDAEAAFGRTNKHYTLILRGLIDAAYGEEPKP